MELRNKNHYHYIRTIRGGSIEKLLNVNTHRRPKQKYRDLKDVYEIEKLRHGKSQPKCLLRAARVLHHVPEMNIKLEPQDYDIDSEGIVGERDGICDGISFVDITLGQILKQCKGKKQKCRNKRRTLSASSDIHIKQEYLLGQPEDDRCDLEEPISNLKARFSKRRKCLSVLDEVKPESEDCCPVSKTSLIPVDHVLDCNKEPRASAKVSIEISRTANPILEAANDVSDELQYKIKQHESCVSGDETTRLVDGLMETDPEQPAGLFVVGKFVISNQDNDSPENCLNANQNPNLGVKVTGWEIVKVERSEIVAMEPLDFQGRSPCRSVDNLEGTDPQNSKSMNNNDSPISADTSLESEEASDSGGSMNPKPDVMKMTGLEIVTIEESREIFTGESLFESNKHLGKDLLICSERYSSSLEASRSQLQESSCETDGTVTPEANHCLQPLNMKNVERSPSAGHGLQSMDLNNAEISCETEDIAKLHSPPEKLFSLRKIISPTSQARLRKEMKRFDSPEKRGNRCNGKLDFSDQNACKIPKNEGLEITPYSKQVIQKGNNIPKKASPKISRRNIRGSTQKHRFNTGCTSIKGCSDNAIAFSQRQMHDIQNIATKLTNELNSMKDITSKCLQSEGNPSETSMDEVKIAIRNAERAQETARKWLAIMERDCSRFCKLMGMVRQDPPATEKGSPKKQKRVRFADDAGGDLCHVMFF